MAQWIDGAGLVLSCLGPLILMVTTGRETVGAVHSWLPPRWAHYLGWGLLSLGFLLQLAAMLIPHDQLVVIASPSRIFHELLVKAVVFVLGFLVAMLMGRHVQSVIDKVTTKPIAPNGISQAELDRALLIGEEEKPIAELIGLMERTLFFVSIYFGAYVLAAGWLALKVASKWAIWQNVVKMPDNFPYKENENVDSLKAFRVKNQWGGRLLNRFMLGTFYNLICGLCGAVVSWFLLALLI
jgi:hypothetical protein